MAKLNWLHGALVCLTLTLFLQPGCAKPHEQTKETNSSSGEKSTEKPSKATGAADSNEVKAVKVRIDELGKNAKYVIKDDLLMGIETDVSGLTASDIALFAKLPDLESLKIKNYRALNDEMVSSLTGLNKLKTLALTNSTISDAGVETIVKSFPNLVELDLSSNTGMTSGVVKILAEMPKLQRLILVQNRINDIGAQRFAKMKELRLLDLRGNMEAGDTALGVIADLPKLTAFKHRSTAVTDSGIEELARSATLDSLLVQDFAITDQAGASFAKLPKLSQLEILRCQGFGSEGVLALKGMGLTRLTLRDLPTIDDRALEVFDDLPKLKRLTLHELSSLGDSGLAHLAALKSLESLDIWSIPQMSDATIDIIASLPELKILKIRETGITSKSIDKILQIKNLQELMLKENGTLSDEDKKKLAAKKGLTLDLGTSADAGADSSQ